MDWGADCEQLEDCLGDWAGSGVGSEQGGDCSGDWGVDSEWVEDQPEDWKYLGWDSQDCSAVEGCLTQEEGLGADWRRLHSRRYI